MKTKLDIINSALVSLGVAAAQDLTESMQSRAATAFWNIALQSTLRAHPWNFAIKRATLAASATPPGFEYAYSYPLPADWLRTLDSNVENYKQEGGAILCNDSVVHLRYVALIEDPARFDALFVEALAAQLSAKLAYPLTQSTSQQSACWDIYKDFLRLARSVDSQEEPADDLPESSLLTVRGGR